MNADALKYSLQALAQSAGFQKRLLKVWLQPPAELPERFCQAKRHLVATGVALTPEQTASLDALHAAFASFSGPTNVEHWREEALVSSPHWISIRHLARGCLKSFGWPLESPPLDLPSYGEDYYELKG
ncbi:hypothetical protein GC207_05820 [bacterium]|nr:hypothetical protein [bacterium]